MGRQRRYLKSHDAIAEHEAVHDGACLPRTSKSGGTARVRLRVVGGTSWPIFLLEEQSLDSAMLLSKASDR